MEWVVVWEWAEFAARWLHVITAIAWIGSSFYFIALDLGLRRHANLPEGVNGEEWQVHGGGFYHIQKYMVAPAHLPEHLIWFKWESYWTWLSGFILLCLVYYLGADIYLIDPNVLDIPAAWAIAISIGSMVIGWVAYSLLCRSPLADNPTTLMLVLFVLLVAVSWGYAQVFSGRAALLHLGAFTATIMSANVFMVIIPNQKIVVADLKAGRTPDPKYGKIAKLRSTHNNYLTLPVIFLMLSNHYPLAFASEYNWVIASLVFLMGVSIRHYFNTRHAGGGNPRWTWGVTAAVFAAIMVLSLLPLVNGRDAQAAAEGRVPTASEQRLMAAPGFSEVQEIVLGRCSMCHAAEPGWDNIYWPPKGVALETAEQIAHHARAIYVQSAVTHAMPPGNLSWMEAEERAAIRNWYEAARQGF